MDFLGPTRDEDGGKSRGDRERSLLFPIWKKKITASLYHRALLRLRFTLHSGRRPVPIRDVVIRNCEEEWGGDRSVVLPS